MTRNDAHPPKSVSDRSLCGWRVRSDIDLPELAAWNCGDRDPDLEIRLCGTPSGLPYLTDGPPDIALTNDGCCEISIPGVANYFIRRGREITIEPYLDAAAPDVRLYLFAPVFGMICHQRNVIPLHASCVAIGGKAVAFAGISGSGKSTLAAVLASRGYPMLADDVCVVEWQSSLLPTVLPSIPRLKLWRDVIEIAGFSAKPEARVRTGMEKYAVPDANPQKDPLPLGTIYHLRETPTIGILSEPLTGLDWTSYLRKAIYPGTEVRDRKLQRTIFEASAFLAANVPNHILCRGRYLTQLQDVADQILQRHES